MRTPVYTCWRTLGERRHAPSMSLWHTLAAAGWSGWTPIPDTRLTTLLSAWSGWLEGDTRWVSGAALASGSGRVSRAVALAMRTPLGRGGSRKWTSEPGAGGGEHDLDSGVFAGVWERATLLEYGGWDERWTRNQDSEMAGRFLAQGERLVCLAQMSAEYTARGSLAGLWRQYLEYGEFREKTAVRHPHTMRRSHLLAPAVVISGAAAVATPRPVRRLARAGLALYATALGWAGARAIPEAESKPDALLVPAVLATMHIAHGTGALRGVLRHGPPLAALAGMLGLSRLAQTACARARSSLCALSPGLFAGPGN